MKKIVIVFFLITTISFSQKRLKDIDSLKVELKNYSGKAKVFILEKIVKNYSFINIDSSLYYNDLMLSLSKKIQNDSLVIYSYNLRGDILHEKAKYSKSINTYKKALSLNKKYKRLEAYSENGLGNNYSKLENFEEAVTKFLKVLDMFESVKDTFMIIGTNFHLANDFRKLKDFESAEKYYEKAIVFNNSKNKFLENFIYNNLSDLYNDMDKPELSLKNSEKALEYFEENNLTKYVPYPLFNRAVAYEKLDKNLLAEKNFLKAIEIHKDFNNNFELANSYNGLAELYLKIGNYNKSINAAKKAIDYSNKVSSIEFQISSHKTLSKAYEKNNDLSRSIYFFSKYDSLNNKFYEANKLKTIKNLSEQYQSEKKEKELLKTRTEKAETELALNKTKSWIYVLIGSLALAILLFFAISQRNKRKAQQQITAQKELGFKAIIDAQEEERSKIARELHDGVVQQIGSVILKSRNLFSNKNLIEEKESKELLESLENSNQDLRNISHQMMPRALKELGIIAALNDLLGGSLAYLNINYNIEHFNIEQRLPQKIEITIYRIAQELINNIIKHSKATEVSLQLFNTNNTVILIVEDNGVGFSTTKSKKGIGLLNISSRLDMVKGNVNFEPSPKSGTLVTIKIPL